MKAGRVMKARRNGGSCPVCHGSIFTRQLIGKVITGPWRGYWVHVQCIVRVPGTERAQETMFDDKD